MKFEVFSLSLAKQEITFTSQNGKICHILRHYTFCNMKSQFFLQKSILRLFKSRNVALQENRGTRAQHF